MFAEAPSAPADDPDQVDLSTSSTEIRAALLNARNALLALVGTCRRALPVVDPQGQSALDRQLQAALDAMASAAVAAHPKAVLRRTGFHPTSLTSAQGAGESGR